MSSYVAREQPGGDSTRMADADDLTVDISLSLEPWSADLETSRSASGAIRGTVLASLSAGIGQPMLLTTSTLTAPPLGTSGMGGNWSMAGTVPWNPTLYISTASGPQPWPSASTAMPWPPSLVPMSLDTATPSHADLLPGQAVWVLSGETGVWARARVVAHEQSNTVWFWDNNDVPSPYAPVYSVTLTDFPDCGRFSVARVSLRIEGLPPSVADLYTAIREGVDFDGACAAAEAQAQAREQERSAQAQRDVAFLSATTIAVSISATTHAGAPRAHAFAYNTALAHTKRIVRESGVAQRHRVWYTLAGGRFPGAHASYYSAVRASWRHWYFLHADIGGRRRPLREEQFHDGSHGEWATRWCGRRSALSPRAHQGPYALRAQEPPLWRRVAPDAHYKYA